MKSCKAFTMVITLGVTLLFISQAALGAPTASWSSFIQYVNQSEGNYFQPEDRLGALIAGECRVPEGEAGVIFQLAAKIVEGNEGAPVADAHDTQYVAPAGVDFATVEFGYWTNSMTYTPTYTVIATIYYYDDDFNKIVLASNSAMWSTD